MSGLSNSLPIRFLIETHIAAVNADEAMFDDSGKCIDTPGAMATEQSEREAFIALAEAQCNAAEDVQAKLEYSVNGPIGERSDFITYLTEHGGGDDRLTRQLFTSLSLDNGRELPSRRRGHDMPPCGMRIFAA